MPIIFNPSLNSRFFESMQYSVVNCSISTLCRCEHPCPPGTYGASCSHRCSLCSGNTTCDSISGKCKLGNCYFNPPPLPPQAPQSLTWGIGKIVEAYSTPIRPANLTAWIDQKGDGNYYYIWPRTFIQVMRTFCARVWHSLYCFPPRVVESHFQVAIVWKNGQNICDNPWGRFGEVGVLGRPQST